jgi:uncharacterized protein YcbK (DUF882 family)
MVHFWKYRSALSEPRLDRRSFLTMGVLTMAASLLPSLALARPRHDERAVHIRQAVYAARARQAGRSTSERYAARVLRDPQAGRTRDEAHVVPPAHEAMVRPEKALALYSPRTGEGLKTVYWYRGKYLPGALRDISYVLRDYRADEVKPIDPQLLELLYELGRLLETRDPFYIMCGYRSPVTNAYLRQYNPAVAERSLHIEGKAVDIRLPGCHASLIRQAAVTLQGGGVGYYPGSNFVHIDTGPIRYW